MKTSLFKSLYFQVLTAIAIGILLGHFYPEIGEQMKPLGDGFVKLIKMIIAPVIFCTVVTGIAGMESMKAVGRTGAVALLYFEIVSTIALIIGLIIVNVVQPGAGTTSIRQTLLCQSGSGLRLIRRKTRHCRLHYGCHPGERHCVFAKR
ncbi:cation:dicarboxylate symporter family transporter [Shigella flexneri]